MDTEHNREGVNQTEETNNMNKKEVSEDQCEEGNTDHQHSDKTVETTVVRLYPLISTEKTTLAEYN